MKLEIVVGDLLSQPVAVIVNPWNQNIVPWWLLAPHGVSGAIKERGGTQPFEELAQLGWLKLGQAVLTSPGYLPYQGIIHVVAINLLGRVSSGIVQTCVKNVLTLANQHHFESIAFPLIGSGAGNLSSAESLQIMQTAIANTTYQGQIIIVKYE